VWKWKEDNEQAITPPTRQVGGQQGSPINPQLISKEGSSMEGAKPLDNFRVDVAHIGKSVVIRGELSGSEDLYLDGEVEGSIELHGHNLTIGPNGRVRASIHAKGVVIHGKVEGKVQGVERVELKRSAVLIGDILTHRIVIEDGAFLKGGVDIQKEAASAPAVEAKREAAVAAPAAAGQGSLLETKK
jgi:cytoskeletal protein CcmA (bactofilin family)